MNSWIFPMVARYEERRTQILPIRRANVAVPAGNGADGWPTCLIESAHNMWPCSRKLADSLQIITGRDISFAPERMILDAPMRHSPIRSISYTALSSPPSCYELSGLSRVCAGSLLARHPGYPRTCDNSREEDVFLRSSTRARRRLCREGGGLIMCLYILLSAGNPGCRRYASTKKDTKVTHAASE